MLIRVFLIAVSQLANKSLRRVIWLGLVGSAVIFLLLVFVISLVLFGTDIFVFHGFLGLFNPILEFFTDLIGVALVLFLSCLLFPSVVYLIVSFFSEDVALAVETARYPYLPEPRKQGKPEITERKIRTVATPPRKARNPKASPPAKARRVIQNQETQEKKKK